MKVYTQTIVTDINFVTPGDNLRLILSATSEGFDKHLAERAQLPIHVQLYPIPYVVEYIACHMKILSLSFSILCFIFIGDQL